MTRAPAVIAYTDRLHVSPGSQIQAHVNAPSGKFEAQLVRLAATREKCAPISSAADGLYAAQDWPIETGSHMVVPGGLACPNTPGITLWVWPTRAADGRWQGLLTWGVQFGLFLDPTGRLVVRWDGASIELEMPLLERRWTSIELRGDSNQLKLMAVTFDGRRIQQVGDAPIVSRRESPASLCIAAFANDRGFEGHFDGKIARPIIRDGADLIAEFQMGADPAANHVTDVGPNVRHGMLVNRPQKGMTGPEWRGDSLGWQDAPSEYDAIAFHSDDLSDAGWPAAFALVVPEDLPSGAYGFALNSEGGNDIVPFFVTAKADRPTADLAFVVPLLSYLAYANERHWWPNPSIEEIAGKPLDEIVGPLERWGEARRLLSLYDYHHDGSGNAHASLRRPLVNVRADYVHPLLRGPHQLSGDILTLDWLRSIDQPVDILTDYCLHEGGAAALAPYRAVMTGSHPEYATKEMLSAFTGYMEHGGKVIHLGGNAFYFVTSIYADEPHVVEVRRGAVGVIPWQSEPGEWRHASTGELGGIWRLRGRSAHAVFGAGTAAVSFGLGRPFVRSVASRDPRFAWIFEGVSERDVDAHGKLSGGPAGFEFDAMRYDLGTPADTAKLATASGFQGASFVAREDVLTTGVHGAPESDMLYRDLPGGGALFAAPSVSWSSCLTANGGDNDVARVTRNVILHFLRLEKLCE